MFGHPLLDANEAAGIIERFLAGTPTYPQEWNDFVDARLCEPGVERYRKRCDELDPLVNCPDPQDEDALRELRKIADELHKLSAAKFFQE